jgi:Arc/MetJ-type ribon-helix-helix transcriptional regulator
MSRRINISIPDYLHDELEKQRDRMNISAVCAEALRLAVVDLLAGDAAKQRILELEAENSLLRSLSKSSDIPVYETVFPRPE